MKTLIVASTKIEIADLLPHIEAKNMDVLICGVGVPACMYSLSKKLINNSYDLVINIGIAGTFNPDFKIGEIVRVTSDQFGDVGVGQNESFLPIQFSKFSNECYQVLTNEYCPLKTTSLKKAKGITVNTISYNSELTSTRKQMFNADIESMEGAGFFLTMEGRDIPYMQIRTVSNLVGEQDKSKWNIPLAVRNLSKEMLIILNNLKLI